MELIEEWIPGPKSASWMNILGLALTLGGMLGFAALYALVNPGVHSVTFSAREMGLLVLTAVITALMVIVHEALHGFALLTLGHRPQFGATMVGGAMPAFYCTSPGALLTKTAFAYVALLPCAVLAAVPALYIYSQLPLAGWLIVPAGILLGGSIGDWFLTVKALHAPKAVLIEDSKDGIRIWGNRH